MSEVARVAAKTPDAKQENRASPKKTEVSQVTDSPVEQILYLQRTIGNRAIERLIRSGALQAKLKISQPGDKYEQEADSVAEQVARVPEPRTRLEAIPLRRNTANTTPTPDNGGSAVTSGRATMNIHAAVRTPGEPLDPATRASMETHFGHDFSSLRVYTSAQAAEAADSINAYAFTLGHDIFFSAGRYQPHSDAGRRLLAHELTHVVQQLDAGPVQLTDNPFRVSKYNDLAEVEARTATADIMGNHSLTSSSLHNPPVAHRNPHVLYRNGPEATAAPAASNILGPQENFRWTGPENAPVLVIRKSWLTTTYHIPASARQLVGNRYTELFTAIISALIQRYPWAEANRGEAMGRISLITLELPEHWSQQDELQCYLSRTVFQVIGLPPSAPIQIYREGSGIEIYADLRTLYGQNATAETMESLKPAIAERMVIQMERTVNHSIAPAQRVAIVNIIRDLLPSQRVTWVQRLNERHMRYLLGDAAWSEFLGQQPSGGTGGTVFQVWGGGYELPSDIPPRDQETVQQLLRELYGAAPEGARPTQAPLALSHEDVQILLRLAKDTRKQQILNLIRQARNQHNVTGTQSIADLIDIAYAQSDMRTSARQLGYEMPEPDPNAQAPIASRPVHGNILNKSGMLVPRMEGKFEFQTTDQVDAFRVPHVDIQWYAVRQGASAGARPIRTERTQYIEVREDSILNDREFTVTFNQTGIYEIHAFVHHNFYLPAHFVIPVEVKTEHQRLQEQETQSGVGFGQTGRGRQYRFGDVARENMMVEVGLNLATPLPVPIGAIRSDDTLGLRSEGTLSDEMFGMPGGSLGLGRRQLQQEIDQLDRMIAQYRTSGSASDLIEWAQQRRDRLVATRDRLSTLAGSADNKPVAIQGNYVTRMAGARSGPLNLIAWFTYEPGTNGSGGSYHGHLFDHSQLVRNEDFHFQESDSTYEAMMEKLFFDITRTYPNGTMSFSFQVYQGLTPTRHFIRFERVTDTLLNDVRNVIFSEPVSLVVNIAATVLTVFPPTAPIGIGISIAYNGLNAALNMAEAVRTDTVRASNYIDIGLVALDVIPLVGRTTRAIRIGERTYRVINATQHAGNAYMFTEGAFQQVQQLRDGMITDLAQLRDEIAVLERNNPSDPTLAEKQRQATQLETRIRNAAGEIFTEMAVNQGLTLAAMHAIGRAAEGHFESHPGSRPPGQPEGGAQRPPAGAPGEAGARPPGGGAEARTEPGIERPREAAARVTGARPASDPVLAQVLPADMQGRIAVRRGPPPDAHEVRVQYDTDALGLITEIRIAAGPDALPSHIEQHLPTVRLMQRYQGIGGAIRILFERIRALVARRGAPAVPGSALFEAGLEVEKLPRIMQERAALLQRQGLDPEIRRDLEADLEHLQSELDRHRRTLDQAEAEMGQGFVAATVPRSNERAIAAGRPRLEGDNAAPGHYYYEPTPGVFELRRYASSNDPPKQLVFENGRWRVVDRPERPRSFRSFLQMQMGSFPEPVTNNPHLEAAIARRFSGNQIDQGGVAIARRWSEALRVLHEGAGADGGALLDRLLGHLGDVTTDTSYGNFRREVRRAMVDQALAQPHPANGTDQRMARIRQLLDALPDSRSQGEVFTLFRERLAMEQGSQLSYMQPIPNAAVALSSGRRADGAVTITQGPPGSPAPGRYLAEDKSGPGAFDPGQAQRYSQQIDQATGKIRTADGILYDGIIYTFDNEANARAALATIQSQHPNIRIGFFDAAGRYIWLR